eukprot:jgi/Antlo1/21/2475
MLVLPDFISCSIKWCTIAMFSAAIANTVLLLSAKSCVLSMIIALLVVCICCSNNMRQCVISKHLRCTCIVARSKKICKDTEIACVKHKVR